MLSMGEGLWGGRLRESIFRDGQWHDIIHMSILKKEYAEKRKLPHEVESLSQGGYLGFAQE